MNPHWLGLEVIDANPTCLSAVVSLYLGTDEFNTMLIIKLVFSF
jgi:hypothetical protein